ncbi:TSC22 domain family protein 2 isoform X2 [Hyperolius riggenbachi]|uniref:TSC22 domain family protein 2 isoform X2 n=1 Tax=Hyperolius riggenbachi TaxID=752182 RepID=UPI0035A30B3B
MSKMPAKKKSCFQITSVTTAQAANSIAEDTESLDDESRTEDVSSEIFDVSRATDYEPEEVVERSSSEETLNNVGEAESPGAMSPNVPQEAPLIGSNVTSRVVPQSQPTPAASTGSPLPAHPATCSSRFRVIKLDHGSGEPYRRGRWTCTDYYDKDSDSTLITRTGDTIRHSSTYDHSADRDSGLGATGGSLATSAVQLGHAPDSIADSSLTAVSHSFHTDKMNQPSQQQHFVIGQQPLGGAVSQGSAPAMYPGAAVTSQQMIAQQGQSYVSTQNIVQSGHNGVGHAAQNVSTAQPMLSASQQHNSVPVSQPQQFIYSQSPMQSGHMVTQSSGQAEYMQHITVIQSQGTNQKAAMSVTGAPSNLPDQHQQASGAQLMGLHSIPSDTVSQGTGLVQSGQTPQSNPAHMQQLGGVAQQTVTPIGVVQQKPISQQVSGNSPVSGILGSHAMTSGVQNVPSTSVSGLTSSVPSMSAIPVTMPITPATFAQSPLSSHTSVSRSNSLIPTVGLLPVQGTNVHTSQFQAQSLTGQIDDRRKSEPLPQPPIPLISEKSFVKVPIMDILPNPLQLPVFGLPVDGEDDSSSSANVVAIDNKIEQAMDLVKSHLMYAVREEVEVLKEQIKELIEKNSTLERENALLKSLSNSDQLSQMSAPTGLSQQPPVTTAPQTTHPPQQPNVSTA